MYIAQLRHIAKQGVWLQQFVFPILATVTRPYLRVFLPCELFLPSPHALLCLGLILSFPLSFLVPIVDDGHSRVFVHI